MMVISHYGMLAVPLMFIHAATRQAADFARSFVILN